MTGNEKKALIDAYWAGPAKGPSLSEVTQLAMAAFPALRGFDASTSYIPLYDIPKLLMKSGDYESVVDLVKELVANQPTTLIANQTDEQVDYDFEAIGTALVSMKEAMHRISPPLTTDQHIEMFFLIDEFHIYKLGGAIHPFLGTMHLNRELSAGNLDVFEFLYKRFKEKDLPNSQLIMANVKDWMRPFFEGKHELHSMLMEDLKARGDKDVYGLADQANNFWLQKDAYINKLSSKSSSVMWQETLRVATEVFDLSRYYPLKRAVADGRAFTAFKGQVDLFLAAKRDGYVISVDEYQKLLDPIERLAKAIGAHWAKKIPVEINNGLSDLFSGTDKAEIIKGNRSKNLIASLQELMPGQGWMSFARQQDKKPILLSQLDL
ncbi:hypothetical protein P5704_025495 (plasmid) [Pseudomonas sp. FeN3W]|nr:hypothetical protein P5704_025495 [Pseudomonas sp. FeN3W]